MTEQANERTVGVLGLGRMGAPIAGRLAAGGRHVVGFDVAGSADRAGTGVTPAVSATEVYDTCDILLLSLPDPAAAVAVVEDIARSERRRVEHVVDLSTIGLTASARCAEIADATGFTYVDAPLSGGVAGAQTGKMAMMVAAPGEAVDRLRPLLEAIADQVFVVGATPGRGQAMKLLNNYVSGTSLAATMEAIVFGQKVGLDITQMVEILNVSSGRTTTSTDKLPRSVVPGTYDFGFAAEAMRKDVGLFVEGASSCDSPRKLAEASASLWDRFVAACPGSDFTYMHRYLLDGGE